MQNNANKEDNEKVEEDRLEKFVGKDLSKNGSSTLMYIIIILVILIVLGGGGYYYYKNYYSKDKGKKMRKDTSLAAPTPKRAPSPPRSGSSGEKLTMVTDQ